jgi:DNA-binding response OmpR family regulator
MPIDQLSSIANWPASETRSRVRWTDWSLADGPARLLLLIEQPALARIVRLAIQHGPFLAHWTRNAREASGALQGDPPQLAVVAADAAEGEILERLGASARALADLPVIALTRRDDLRTILRAFDWGVVDILSAPFTPGGLVARILVTMWRHYRRPLTIVPAVRVGALEIDILSRSARVGATYVQLSTLELSLLYVLAANAGHVLPRQEIAGILLGSDGGVGSDAIDFHVRHLRAQLAERFHRPPTIVSLPGQGYRFDVDPGGSSPASPSPPSDA